MQKVRTKPIEKPIINSSVQFKKTRNRMSVAKQEQIVQLYLRLECPGSKYGAVGQLLNINRGTVRDVICRYLERGKVERRDSDTGRKLLDKTKRILEYINDD